MASPPPSSSAPYGYFVDVYDLQLFSVVRRSSLVALGVPEGQLLDTGVLLINVQMIGMLLGGLFWGVLGDRRGRASVLYGSIALYSLANLCNAFVHSVGAYALWRFIAGVGLAGELGAAITLVSELLPAKSRGYGTTVVATVGLAGAVVASLVGSHFTWSTAYLVGGGLGVVLLVMRVGMLESAMFAKAKETHVRRGDLGLLFGDARCVSRFVACVLVGVPIWFSLGVVMTFAPEIARDLGVVGAVRGESAVLYTYLGVVAGNLVTGLASQWIGSRKRVLLASIVATAVAVVVALTARGVRAETMYAMLFGLGVAIGYWAIFATVAAEQFGTNLRATVATSVPNLVRGAVVPLTLSFKALKGSMGASHAAGVVGAVTMVVALVAWWRLEESYGRELDFHEG